MNISPSIQLLFYALYYENRNSHIQVSQLQVKKADTAFILLPHFTTLAFKTVRSEQTPILTVLIQFNINIFTCEFEAVRELQDLSLPAELHTVSQGPRPAQMTS